jgi:hypothetical protein
MNSVCIRRPAEFSGYSRLRSIAPRSVGGSFSRISSCSSSQRLQQFDGVVGFQFAHALRDRLGFELFEDLLADRIVDLVQRREVEIGTRQLHQADAVIAFQGPDQIAEIGLMQLRNHRAQQRHLRGMDRARNLLDEFPANFAIFIAHREMIEPGGIGELGNVDLFGHATPRRFDRILEFV